jgi:hypothetical protein
MILVVGDLLVDSSLHGRDRAILETNSSTHCVSSNDLNEVEVWSRLLRFVCDGIRADRPVCMYHVVSLEGLARNMRT